MDPVLQQAVVADTVQGHSDLDPGVVVVGISGRDAAEEITRAVAIRLRKAKQGCRLRLMPLHLLEQQRRRLSKGEITRATALDPAVCAGDGMSACDDGLTASPAQFQLLAFDRAAELGGLDGGPEGFGHLIDDLKAAITAGGDSPRLGQLTQWCADLLQHLRGAEAIVIDKQQAAGLWTCDDANGYGTAGVDLGGELVLGERVLLPLGLIWTLVVADCDQSPMIG